MLVQSEGLKGVKNEVLESKDTQSSEYKTEFVKPKQKVKTAGKNRKSGCPSIDQRCKGKRTERKTNPEVIGITALIKEMREVEGDLWEIKEEQKKMEEIEKQIKGANKDGEGEEGRI